jgi:protoporphyrinogen oxidase
MTQEKKIVIIGAGPTGLGAAWRLNQLGYSNWSLIERSNIAGGLAGSITDEKGFTWDLGGHVQFSHYGYFDDLMDELLGEEGWLYHERESWVWIRERFVPYPFQLNIRKLPVNEIKECISGLVRLYKNGSSAPPHNFGEWIEATFGSGLARIFMRPYNFKVWAYPPEDLNFSWIGERVAVVDLERVLNNIFDEKDDISWGPNNTFRFPKHGGTGSVWRECARRLPQERLRFDTEVSSINPDEHALTLASGEVVNYDLLLTTVPLDIMVSLAGLDQFESETKKLLHSSTHIFGIGLNGSPPADLKTKCWLYFPESNCPFYRVTVFSNYSPFNVPDISRNWSLMAEVSESPSKPVSDPNQLMEDVIQGMLNTKLIRSRTEIIDKFQVRLEHGYPTPSLERDEIIYSVLPQLEDFGIYSRGRFGAWRYEVSNQDHSLMQGVEWVDRMLGNGSEETLWHPEIVNSRTRSKTGAVVK